MLEFSYTSQLLKSNERGHYEASTDRGAVLVSVLDRPTGITLAMLAAGGSGREALSPTPPIQRAIPR